MSKLFIYNFQANTLRFTYIKTTTIKHVRLRVNRISQPHLQRKQSPPSLHLVLVMVRLRVNRRKPHLQRKQSPPSLHLVLVMVRLGVNRRKPYPERKQSRTPPQLFLPRLWQLKHFLPLLLLGLKQKCLFSFARKCKILRNFVNFW